MKARATFDPAEHVYRLDGRRVPSVTQVIQRAGMSTDYRDVPPQHLINAARIGRAVHAEAARLTEAGSRLFWRSAALAYDHEHPRVEAAVRGWASWMHAMNPEILATERKMVSAALWLAGTLDLACVIQGVRWLIDYKCTSARDPVSWGLQTGGYKILWDEAHPQQPIERRGALHIRGDQPMLVPLDDDTDTGRFWGALQSTRNHEWEEEPYVYEF